MDIGTTEFRGRSGNLATAHRGQTTQSPNYVRRHANA